MKSEKKIRDLLEEWKRISELDKTNLIPLAKIETLEWVLQNEGEVILI